MPNTIQAANYPTNKLILGHKSVNKPRISIGFILAKNFTLCAFANFVDVLRLASDEGDKSRRLLCDWSILSDTMNPIIASCGTAVMPTERLADPSKFDYIAVIGGLIDNIDTFNLVYIQYLQKADKLQIPLISICTGSFILHRAGLMDGYRCCVSWFHHQDFLERFPDIQPVSDQIFVVDRNRLTCSGGVSSAHLAAYLVEKHIGRAQANKSLYIMMIDDLLSQEKPQPGMPMKFLTNNTVIKKAMLMMQQNIETPLNIKDIAKKIGQSKRQLERQFRLYVNKSPQEVYIEIRLSLAHHLITNTDKSISSVAVDCGFCDASHLSRMFRRHYNMTPQNLRKTKNTTSFLNNLPYSTDNLNALYTRPLETQTQSHLSQ